MFVEQVRLNVGRLNGACTTVPVTCGERGVRAGLVCVDSASTNSYVHVQQL